MVKAIVIVGHIGHPCHPSSAPRSLAKKVYGDGNGCDPFSGVEWSGVYILGNGSVNHPFNVGEVVYVVRVVEVVWSKS